MLCQICKKNEATIILTRIVNGEKREIHICENCAKLFFSNELTVLSLPQFNLNNLLIGLLNAIDLYGQEEEAIAVKELKCQNCKLTYDEFRKSGKLGCSECYQYFREKLIPLFKKLHGNTQHRGKVPHQAEGKLNKIKKVEYLKKELQDAVSKEKYEKAAQIRDRILKIKGDPRQEDAK
ncbi:MAG: UvrB/UvrC motif-containing protein [Candidatus Caldatribacteriota bacterium]|nr:UvrB/UvrC motif-containing protein [Candidatus Caldatribacteriota bacterium]